jgi:hypothetical protein
LLRAFVGDREATLTHQAPQAWSPLSSSALRERVPKVADG